MAKQELSIPQLTAMIRDESDAYLMLERLRWDGRPVCPLCGSAAQHYFLTPANGVSRKTRTGRSTRRRVWKCKDCLRQFSVLTGTVFHAPRSQYRPGSWSSSRYARPRTA
jgi:hypothetical protein